MIVLTMPQGSPEWHDARCGVITMSNAKAMLTAGKGLTRRSYFMTVAAERITGIVPDSYQSDMMLRGQELEPYARRAVEATMGIGIEQVGFVYLDEGKRIGCSPDGFANHRALGVEIKCPNVVNHMKTLMEQAVPPEKIAQAQGGMWVTGANVWLFASFCPEFTAAPLYVQTIERNQPMIDKLSDSCLNGIEEIDEMVRDVRQFGRTKEVAEIAADAAEYMRLLANEGDVAL